MVGEYAELIIKKEELDCFYDFGGFDALGAHVYRSNRAVEICLNLLEVR